MIASTSAVHRARDDDAVCVLLVLSAIVAADVVAVAAIAVAVAAATVDLVVW